MRRKVYWTGLVILLVLPLLFTAEILIKQDLPPVQPWKWALLAGALLMVLFARNRDEVLKHHIV